MNKDKIYTDDFLGSMEQVESLSILAGRIVKQNKDYNAWLNKECKVNG
tara:strand:+ start:125 stop:268 length:144 start_codon:yes stop_codon:yes gene_type:complete